MPIITPLNRTLHRRKGLLLVIMIVCYFFGQSLSGENGMISGIKRYQEWQNKKEQLAILENQMQEMKLQTDYLRDDHLDLDLIEEYIRNDLGYSYPNENTIQVRPLPHLSDGVESK